MPRIRVKEDGRILNIPDGVDPNAAVSQYLADQAAAKQQAEKQAAQQAMLAAEQKRVEGMGSLQRFGEGALQGVFDTARGAGNIVGLVDDEDVYAANLRNKALRDTTAGKVGHFTGGTAALIAATAPLGPLAGAAGLGGSTLAAGTARAALQGAAAGAIAADPNERVGGAVLGGLLGGGLNVGLAGAGRVASGLGKISKDARALQRTLGTHVPLNMALAGDDAASRLLRTGYGLAALDPVGGSALKAQGQRLGQAFADRVAATSTPRGLGVAAPRLTLEQSASAGGANRIALNQVEKQIQNLTTTFNNARVEMGAGIWNGTVRPALNRITRSSNTKLDAEIRKILDETLPIGRNNTVTLQQVGQAMAELRQLRNAYGGGQAAGAGKMVDDLIAAFEDLGRQRLSVTQPTFGVRAGAARAWDTWTGMIRSGDLWKWNNLLRGVDKQGMITPSSLHAGMDASSKTFLAGAVPNQRLLSLGKQVMEDDAAHIMGAFGTNVALGPLKLAVPALGTATGAALGGPWGAAAGASLLPILSRQGTQRFLTGQQQWQKLVSQYLRNNPQLLSQWAGRGGVAAVPMSEGTDDGTVR